MTRYRRARAVLVAAFLLLGVASSVAADSPPISRQAFNADMRKLWEDHITWTRLYVVSAIGGLPDKDATAQRLLQNQADIGNAVAEFYGRDAGNKLTGLLKDHILIAASIVAAAKAGDNAKVTSENKRWHDNAVDLARFLHGANAKNWPEATLQSALFTHLDQTLSEASNQLKGNYAASIKDYDGAMDHMLMVADILSDGIVKQFPSKFNEGKKK